MWDVCGKVLRHHEEHRQTRTPALKKLALAQKHYLGFSFTEIILANYLARQKITGNEKGDAHIGNIYIC